MVDDDVGGGDSSVGRFLSGENRFVGALVRAGVLQHQNQSSLAAVDVRPSRLSGAEGIVDVVLSFRGRATDLTEQFFVRVNVTGEFPFVLTGLQPFFER